MELQAKNLRIGNKASLYGNTATIQGVDFVKHYSGGNEHFDRFKPIPLTEKWLINFGFSDKDYKVGYIGIDIKLSNGMTGDFTLTKPKLMGEWQNNYVFELRKHRFIEIPYVHELQNLFFVINNKELKYK